MSVVDSVYTRLPEETRPIARKWFHIFHPGLSWKKRKKVDTVEEAVIDRFFESSEEFEEYESEFFEGRIVDICRSAMERVPDDVSIYDAHMDECVRLYALVRKYQLETIVETGIYQGVSTASLLLALEKNGAGTLHSLGCAPLLAEHYRSNEEGIRSDGAGTHRFAEVGGVSEQRARFYERGRPSCSEAGTHRLSPNREPGWIIPEDLHDRWERTIGLSQRTLPRLLSNRDGVDLFAHDSEHSRTGMLFEFDLAWEHLVPGGLLVSFHVDRNDAFETFTKERLCDHGLLTYTYNGFEHYDEPCSSGYAIKPGPLS